MTWETTGNSSFAKSNQIEHNKHHLKIFSLGSFNLTNSMLGLFQVSGHQIRSELGLIMALLGQTFLYGRRLWKARAKTKQLFIKIYIS